MKSFYGVGRVEVTDPNSELCGKSGSVRRLRRCDEWAWVEMDEAVPDNLRSFPPGDPGGRENHVCLHPGDCKELARGNQGRLT